LLGVRDIFNMLILFFALESFNVCLCYNSHPQKIWTEKNLTFIEIYSTVEKAN